MAKLLFVYTKGPGAQPDSYSTLWARPGPELDRPKPLMDEDLFLIPDDVTAGDCPAVGNVTTVYFGEVELIVDVQMPKGVRNWTAESDWLRLHGFAPVAGSDEKSALLSLLFPAEYRGVGG